LIRFLAFLFTLGPLVAQIPVGGVTGASVIVPTLLDHQAATTSAGVATVTTTLSSGATLFVCVGSWGGTQHPCADSSSNTWTCHTTTTDNDTEICYVLNPTTTASMTITLTATDPGMVFFSYSGPAHYDQTCTANGVSGGTSLNSCMSSVTPNQANSILVSALGFSATQTVSVGSSFTNKIEQNYNGSTPNYGAAGATLYQATAAAVNPQWTWSASMSASALVSVFY
jgi:hypothetical protein